MIKNREEKTHKVIVGTKTKQTSEILVQIEKKTKKKHNNHQHNTDEGRQEMGDDINIAQMMVGKQWVKN